MVAETGTATSPAKPGSDPEAMIRLGNISRWFGSTCAVNQVSFDVHAGEVFGFIGPNGAGKTTSMRILATLDIPTTGDAWVDGFSVIDDADRVRRRLGFMPDGFGTYPNVNCEEYLDFFARAYGLRGKERLRALREVMGFTQLDQMAHKPITGLSKGMKQRLCLGRTLIHDPKVLVLDEPAAGLDPRARIELRDMIVQLAEQGKSLLISSHILTELAEMCDRVAIIEQGSLLAVGTVDEILHNRPHTSPTADSTETAPLRTRMNVSVLGDPGAVADWLRNRDQVSDLKPAGKTVTFEFDADPERHVELLKAMIDAGFPITSFTGKQRSLEDAFLQVTKGRVQ